MQLLSGVKPHFGSGQARPQVKPIGVMLDVLLNEFVPIFFIIAHGSNVMCSVSTGGARPGRVRKRSYTFMNEPKVPRTHAQSARAWASMILRRVPTGNNRRWW